MSNFDLYRFPDLIENSTTIRNLAAEKKLFVEQCT